MRIEEIAAKALEAVGDDRYKLALLVAKRAEAIANGAQILVDVKRNSMNLKAMKGFTTIQILAGIKPQIIILHICMVLASDINTLIYFKQNAFTSTSSPLGRKIALTYYKICILFLFLINKII